MGDNKRMLMAMIIILFILLLFTLVTKPQRRPQPIPPKPPLPKERVEKPKPLPVVKKEIRVKPDTLVLENDKLRLKFSTLGGDLISAELKKYPGVNLIPKGGSVLNLTLLSPDTSLDMREVLWKFRLREDRVDFFYRWGKDTLKKRFGLENGYDCDLTISVPRGYSYQLGWKQGLNITEPNRGDDLRNFRIFLKTQEGVKGFAAKNIGKIPSSKRFQWVALTSKYFLAGAFFEKPPASIKVFRCPDTLPKAKIVRDRLGLTLSISYPENKYRLVFAPLKYDLLKSYKSGLEKAVGLGAFWYRPISLGILYLLKTFFSFFKNYGWAIVFFALLMKLAFFPFSSFSFKQMHKMQALQPKLEELKKKYKNDPQRMNQEMMRLYKLYKVNPVSGCLPLLIQMPVFFALYSVLRSTVELRRAGFLFWIQDLSVKDPYYILPLLMGASFLAQTLLTSTDKRQRMFQILMPVFFTVIFLKFPSGLQLYWFIFNILSIIEQFLVRKGGIKWQKI